jgi:uncharacterized protein YfiM (DUF2279 family)
MPRRGIGSPARDGLCPHDGLVQRNRERADLLGGSQQTGRRPEGVSVMRAGHVLWDRAVTALHPRAGVARDAAAAMNTSMLASVARTATTWRSMRDGTEWKWPATFDMVARRHAGAWPFDIVEGLSRQRHQDGPVDGVEELAAAGTKFAHQANVGGRRLIRLRFSPRRGPSASRRLHHRQDPAPMIVDKHNR